MSSFKWGKGTIHIRNSSVKTRLKQERLNRLIKASAIEDEFEAEAVATATFYLAHVDKVTGKVGFDIPNGNATQESVQAFIDAFLDADEQLMYLWDNAIVEARNITNDADLLPPEEIDPNA